MLNPPYQHSVGVDVSKLTLDICLWSLVANGVEKAATHVKNNPQGHEQLMDWLQQQGASPETTVICLENTGLYDDRLLDRLIVGGWVVAVEPTTCLLKVRPAHHRKADGFDAQLLAEYAVRFADQLSLYQPPNPVIEEIRLLYRERRRLVDQRAAVKQLLGEAAYRIADTTFAKQVWAEQVQFYDRTIDAIETQIQSLIDADAEMKKRYHLLRSVTGKGAIAAWLWLCLFYGQSKLDARRIASRFGFAPHESSSGSSVNAKRRSTGHGASEVRKVLTMCARSAATHHQKFAGYKQRKLAEGKASKLVTNNVINKLIRIVTAVWNSQTMYDDSHVSRFAQAGGAAN